MPAGLIEEAPKPSRELQNDDGIHRTDVPAFRSRFMHKYIYVFSIFSDGPGGASAPERAFFSGGIHRAPDSSKMHLRSPAIGGGYVRTYSLCRVKEISRAAARGAPLWLLRSPQACGAQRNPRQFTPIIMQLQPILF